jgi:hypothetical protein
MSIAGHVSRAMLSRYSHVRMEAKRRAPGLKGHKYVSIQIRVDTTVAAGLYNAFVVVRLALQSTTHYATLGFEE